ncbi:MAG: SDR family oxidoreductase [Halopseudomonas aestusnigri]
MLKDRVILVTGSHSGIGYSTAQLCQEYGAKVVIHGRDSEQLKISAEKLGPDVLAITADLENPNAPGDIIKQVISHHGRIDGLVNNAARLDRSTLDTLSVDVFDQVMTVNVRAPLMLIKAALPHFEEQKNGGSIVNVGSINAYCGAQNLLAYSASKAALMTVTRNLGDSLGSRSIRVNQINVGWTLTENEHRLQLSEGQPANWLENIPKSFAPSGSILEPKQIAEHIAFWLSDRSAPITGQVYEAEQYPVIGRNPISER